MKFEVEYADESTDEIEIPTKLPYRIGKKIRESLKIKMSGNGEKLKREIENPTKMLTSIQDILIKDVLPEEVDKDRISTETADRLVDKYYEQIQGKVKKGGH